MNPTRDARHRPGRIRAGRGFSLLELLVVLLLLGAFAGIFAPKIFGQAEKAKRNAAKLRDRPDRAGDSTCSSSRSAAIRRPGRPRGAGDRALGRLQLERSVPEERRGPQGSVEQRVQVRAARRPEPPVRHRVVRIGRQGRRRRRRQGHHQLAMMRSSRRGRDGIGRGITNGVAKQPAASNPHPAATPAGLHHARADGRAGDHADRLQPRLAGRSPTSAAATCARRRGP